MLIWTLFGGLRTKTGGLKPPLPQLTSVSPAQMGSTFRTSWASWLLQCSTMKKVQLRLLLRMGPAPLSNNVAPTTNPNWFEMGPNDAGARPKFLPVPLPFWLFPLITPSLLLSSYSFMAHFGATLQAMRPVTVTLNQLHAHFPPPLFLPIPQPSQEISHFYSVTRPSAYSPPVIISQVSSGYSMGIT